MHARADEVVFARHAETPIGGAEAKQHRPGSILRPVSRLHAPVAAIDLDGGDFLGGEDFDPEALSLGAKAVGELGAGDPFGEAGEVIEPLRDARLAANAAAFDDEDIQPFARGIERSRQPGRAAADDNEVVEAALGRGL